MASFAEVASLRFPVVSWIYLILFPFFLFSSSVKADDPPEGWEDLSPVLEQMKALVNAPSTFEGRNTLYDSIFALAHRENFPEISRHFLQSTEESPRQLVTEILLAAVASEPAMASLQEVHGDEFIVHLGIVFRRGTNPDQAFIRARQRDYEQRIKPLKDHAFNSAEALNKKIKRIRQALTAWYFVKIALVAGAGMAVGYEMDVLPHDRAVLVAGLALATHPAKFLIKYFLPKIKNPTLKKHCLKLCAQTTEAIKAVALFHPGSTIPVVREIATSEEGEQADLVMEAATDALFQVPGRESSEALMQLAVDEVELGNVAKAEEVADVIIARDKEGKLAAIAKDLKKLLLSRQDLLAVAKQIRLKLWALSGGVGGMTLGGTALGLNYLFQSHVLDYEVAKTIAVLAVEMIGLTTIYHYVKARLIRAVEERVPSLIQGNLSRFEDDLFNFAAGDVRLLPVVGAILNSTGDIEVFERRAAQLALERLEKIYPNEAAKLMRNTGRRKLRRNDYVTARHRFESAYTMATDPRLWFPVGCESEIVGAQYVSGLTVNAK